MKIHVGMELHPSRQIMQEEDYACAHAIYEAHAPAWSQSRELATCLIMGIRTCHG